jgi:hypothetical protein
MVFLLTASTVISRAFATELFPTSYRGTATGWLLVNETLGAAAGLSLVSIGMHAGFELTGIVSLVSAASLVGADLPPSNESVRADRAARPRPARR